MLKKVSLIIVIAVLACSQAGYYFIIRHQQNVHKENIKEKIWASLKEDELEIISFTADQPISWQEEGKEFLLNGEMYDVVKTKTIHGKQVFYCINDRKEKALIDRYNLQTKQNSSQDKKGKRSADNQVNLFICSEENNAHPFLLIPSATFPVYVSTLAVKTGENVSPPPKA